MCFVCLNTSAPTKPKPIENGVIVTDIQMSFGSMVEFMVKWAIASIPALIILSIVGFFVAVFLAGLMGATSR